MCFQPRLGVVFGVVGLIGETPDPVHDKHVIALLRIGGHPRQGIGQRPVKRTRAERSAGHQHDFAVRFHPQRLLAPPLFFIVERLAQGENFGPHRVADKHAVMLEVDEGFGKRHADTTGHFTEGAVDQPRVGVLLVHENRPAQQPRGQQRRRAGIAAGGDDQLRAIANERRQRLERAQRQGDQKREHRQRKLARRHTAGRHEADGNAVSRHDVRFGASFYADI